MAKTKFSSDWGWATFQAWLTTNMNDKAFPSCAAHLLPPPGSCESRGRTEMRDHLWLVLDLSRSQKILETDGFKGKYFLPRSFPTSERHCLPEIPSELMEYCWAGNIFPILWKETFLFVSLLRKSCFVSFLIQRKESKTTQQKNPSH